MAGRPGRWSTAPRRSASSLDGELDSVGTLLVEDGLVTGIYWVRNPEKLARLDAVVALTR